MDCETRLEEEPRGNSLPIGKTKTEPILSRLRPLTEPLKNPKNPRIRQPKNRPKTRAFAGARHLAKKVEIFLKKSLRSIWIFVFLSLESIFNGVIRLSGLSAE